MDVDSSTGALTFGKAVICGGTALITITQAATTTYTKKESTYRVNVTIGNQLQEPYWGYLPYTHTRYISRPLHEMFNYMPTDNLKTRKLANFIDNERTVSDYYTKYKTGSAGVITYKSSDTNIVLDPTFQQLSLPDISSANTKTVGSAVITITQPASGSYAEKTATYTMRLLTRGQHLFKTILKDSNGSVLTPTNGNYSISVGTYTITTNESGVESEGKYVLLRTIYLGGSNESWYQTQPDVDTHGINSVQTGNNSFTLTVTDANDPSIDGYYKIRLVDKNNETTWSSVINISKN